MIKMIIIIKVIKVIELIYIIRSKKMKFCIDDKDVKYTTDFLIIFSSQVKSRISFAAPISSPVHTAKILSHDPIQAGKTGHAEAPSFSPVSETWVLVCLLIFSCYYIC